MTEEQNLTINFIVGFLSFLFGVGLTLLTFWIYSAVEEPKFGPEAIRELKRSLELNMPIARRAKDDLWLSAFAAYNAKNEKKLSPNCSSCYVKVLMFIKMQAHV